MVEVVTGFFMFLVKKFPITSQIAAVLSFEYWAMPNTENFFQAVISSFPEKEE